MVVLKFMLIFIYFVYNLYRNNVYANVSMYTYLFIVQIHAFWEFRCLARLSDFTITSDRTEMNSNNHIFVSYKALGFVTNNVPISIGYYRKLKKPYVVTCIGRSFHVYNVSF